MHIPLQPWVDRRRPHHKLRQN